MVDHAFVSMLLKEDMAMKTFDYSPFYRSTVGFDRLFDMLDNSVRPDWPPYDIEKLSDNEYRISMAVAGFNQDEIELTQTGTELLVTGQKKTEEANRQVLHRGIAQRNFKQTFNLASHVRVAGAKLENGLLSVDLVRELPEQLKPRRIEIGASATAAPMQNNEPKQIEQNANAA
jgi:molecular chaperone IbpA